VAADGFERELEVGPSGSVSLALPRGAAQVAVKTVGPGLLARVDRRDLRPWSSLPNEAASPVRIEVEWPSDARAGGSSRVRVSLRHELGRPTIVDARLPLPPGAALAEPVEGVRMLQGVLALRRSLDDSSLPAIVEVPVRFRLAGRMIVPEAHARLAFEEAPRAIAPARGLAVRP
jgi:hypothetical protein